MIKIEIKNRWTGSIIFEYSKENNTIKEFRILLIDKTSEIIKNGMLCLGIDVPERM